MAATVILLIIALFLFGIPRPTDLVRIFLKGLAILVILVLVYYVIDRYGLNIQYHLKSAFEEFGNLLR